MRILVYPHEMSIGGSQINAIDLASQVAKAGHEVIVYAEDGPLVSYIAERGLRYIAAVPAQYRPRPARVRQLARLATEERLDLIHAYEWPGCLDAYFGATLLKRVPVLCTVLSMNVSPFVPASVPLVMGTEVLADEALAAHSAPVWTLEPPIDTDRDTPDIDGSNFRRQHGVGPDELLVVTVSRLALDLKLDALVRAIDAVASLAERYPLRLILVGDGAAREALEARAEAVNRRLGRCVVSLPGAELDPRSAYASADIVLGMGSSVIRAMAIGRPVIVQGEQAFSKILDDTTLELFLRQGFYGKAGAEQGVQVLAGQIESLVTDTVRRQTLGLFGRNVAVQRLSLQRAGKLQLSIYEEVLAGAAKWRLSEAALVGWRALAQELLYHDPRWKRDNSRQEAKLLAAARHGTWPLEVGGV